MTEEKLNLLQFASIDVTQLRTCSPQIVRREMIKLHSLGTIPNHIPDDVLRETFAPCGSMPAYCPKDSAVCDTRCRHPPIDCALYPNRHRNRANMAALSYEIHDCPVAVTDLDLFFPQGRQFRSSEATSEQDGDHGHVGCNEGSRHLISQGANGPDRD
jgi:hypothetical protein